MTQLLKTKEESLCTKLLFTGILMLVVYLAITWLSFSCEQSDPEATRPLLTVVALFTIAGLGYLFVCWQAIWKRTELGLRESNFDGLKIVFAFGVVFRLVLLFSVPIQEVDLYRYIWDGTVTSQGISPYEYSPLEVERFPTEGVPSYRTRLTERADLTKLSRLATSPSLRKSFKGVHFEEYTTPYPLVNQIPFAVAATIGRSTGNFWGLLYAMKGMLILFDLATALLLVALLKRLCLPTNWVVAYLWCPLLLKEIANSGHLDSIAVFFTVAAVYVMVAAYWKAGDSDSLEAAEIAVSEAEPLRAYSIMGSCGIAVLLALAVGAKLFPVILGPIWAVLMFKRLRFAALLPLIVFTILTAMLLWPMVGKTKFVRSNIEQARTELVWLVGDEGRKVSPPVVAPPAGIEAFVSRWEMNDFIFMIAIENLKPYGESAERFAEQNESTDSSIWFVKTSNEFRHRIIDWYRAWTGCPKAFAPFSMTRRLTLIVFSLIVLWTCVRMWRHDHPLVLLEMVFLTIAWFWFLAPTQNPWYWTWALPWLMFCRNRIWYVVAIVAMAYYLRFYFEYHGVVDSEESGLLGTPYSGTEFFDFIFPVLEFAPILVAVLISWSLRICCGSGKTMLDR